MKNLVCHVIASEARQSLPGTSSFSVFSFQFSANEAIQRFSRFHGSTLNICTSSFSVFSFQFSVNFQFSVFSFQLMKRFNDFHDLTI
jgi:hypothetical protein